MAVGFVLAGVASGVGKTTLTLGLLGALRARGLKVAPFKAGPDYIDPGLHRLAAGRISHNLDTWMMGPSVVRSTFYRAIGGADVALVEGVMGLFDGGADGDPAGSTADLAKTLGLPVILVVDAAKMAGSVAAVVHGFASLDPEVRVAGVILNRVASDNHLRHLIRALTQHTQIPVLGHLMRDAGVVLAERHLGLMTADELTDRVRLTEMADRVAQSIDLDALMALAAPLSPAQPIVPYPPSRVRLGVARDAAFGFAYPSTLEALARAGAEIVPFSPLVEFELPEDLHGLYLPGGYPELHGERLGANRVMREAIQQAAADGLPIFAECGGLIYLSEGVQGPDGKLWPMCGVLPATCELRERRVALGYRSIVTTRDSLLGPAGTALRGHEFRYSEVDRDRLSAAGVGTALALTRRGTDGVTDEGFQIGHTLASYAHVVVSDTVAKNWVEYLCQHGR